MSIQALKVDDSEDDGLVVVHRNFEGEHELSGTSCWCRPELIAPDSYRDSSEIVELLERADG